MPELTSTCPLTANQQFIRAYDVGNDAGPFGPHYTITHGWWITGKVSREQVQRAMTALAGRHEVLNTIIRRDLNDSFEARQEIHQAAEPRLELYRESNGADRRQRVAEHIDAAERSAIEADELPLFRGRLVEFEPDLRLLVLTFHHLVVDGFAVRILARELAHLVAHEQGYSELPLPTPSPYREYAEWEADYLQSADAESHREYWRHQLAQARIHTWPTDFSRSDALPASTGTHKFAIDGTTTKQLLEAARGRRATSFMAYFAVYALLCSADGRDEVTIPTFTPGRPKGFDRTIGPFFNFMPLRVDLRDCNSYNDVLDRVREVALDGAEHDIPTIPALVPETMEPAMRPDQATGVFQVFPYPNLLTRSRIGELEFTEITEWESPEVSGAEIPDGTLWTVGVDPEASVTNITLNYRRDLYERSTVRDLADRFVRLLTEAATHPDAPLGSERFQDA